MAELDERFQHVSKVNVALISLLINKGVLTEQEITDCLARTGAAVDQFIAARRDQPKEEDHA